MLNLRVDLHAIDATPVRWRDDAGSSPLDGASTNASSPRNDLVKNSRCVRHWLISTQVARLCQPQGPRAGPEALGTQGLPPRGNDPGHEGDAAVPMQRGARVRPLQGAGARVPGGRGVLVLHINLILSSRGERTRRLHFHLHEHRGRIGTSHCQLLVGTRSRSY